MPEPADVLAPKQFRFLSGSELKVIAVVSMFIDHITAYILQYQPEYTVALATFGDLVVTPAWILRTIGRLAFPIFCFLLVEGCTYTHSRIHYGRNLLLFALISEIPFNFARKGIPFDPTYQNVFFTLFLGFLGICAYEKLRDNRAYQAFAVIGLAIVTMGLRCDYAERGYALILILYYLRNNAVAKTALGCCVTTASWRAGLAFIPINLYNGTRGFVHNPVLKYAFYAFYPLHLFAIWWFRTHAVM